MKTWKLWIEAKKELQLATANEYGVQFVTGHPVTFKYNRNTEKAGYYGDTYLQNIEPAGRYLIHNPSPGQWPPNWEQGEVTFQKPLVIPFNPVDPVSYDENNWKTALYNHYGKTGRALSRAIRASGYDGIVTVGQGLYTREIVDLTNV